jgi:protein required for attachment to host cells
MTNNERRAILIAPPKVLGIMRSRLLDEVRKQIVAEIAKDYCGQSALELTKLLSDYDPNK